MAETDDYPNEAAIKTEDLQLFPEVAVVKSIIDDDELAAEQLEDGGSPAWTWTNEDYSATDFMPEKDFILKLESIKELWDPSCPNYTNRRRRFQNLSKLLPILRRIKPDATIHDVKRKINTFRSNFRRELRKMSLSQQSGAEVPYRPKLWYFPYVRFLLKLEKNGEVINNIIEQEMLSKAETASESINGNANVTASSISYRNSTFNRREPVSKKKKKNHSISVPGRRNISKIIKTDKKYSSAAINIQNNRSELNHKPVISTNNTICSSQPIVLNNYPIALEWASALDRLDPLQRLHAKKAINDILYEAELGNLISYSVRVNQNGSGQSVSTPPVYIVNPTNTSITQQSMDNVQKTAHQA